jgi:5-hydroxyisourate hydrolase
MSAITTHILDTSRGTPGAGVALTLETLIDGTWTLLARSVTDGDGRARLVDSAAEGRYRLTFHLDPEGFYPEAAIQFRVRDTRHHHIPLLLSPYGYSTYRGS